MAITLEDTLAAISLLQNAEVCSRVSGTAEYRQWGKNDLTGPPKHVQTVHFSVDNESGSWSEDDVKYGGGRRFSRESGQEYVDHGEVVDYLSGISEWPKLIKMLRPSKFEIWGRPGDKWRMTGAESTEHGYLLHLDRDTSPAVAELFIDTTFSLPIRWTEVHPIGPTARAKQEVEILALHIPREWKQLTGMDMSEQGELMVSFMVEER
ncbi:hypothetical protein IA539_15515 [Gordonia sp. zg691]|uniref:hypothetical protein n=1 Tax=Gordonia jinghuaiqii TaxID=2758710 RepID=UPI001662852F|nr:hypothetical protein [Gordonia jinghuaiqii]MBD0862609.1 hypothetical protein [Gordonia jinghuaiqii]